MQITSNRVIFDRDDFLAGFVPVQSNNDMRIFGVRGSAFHKNMDPLFGGIPGTLRVGRNPTNLTGVSTEPTSLLNSICVDPVDTSAYAIGGAKIQKITVTSDTLVTSSWPVTASPHGGHSALDFGFGDIVIYQRTGSLRAFYSWNDSNDWDVGMFDLSSTFDDDFMSTVPTTPLGTTAADLTGGQNKPHPLYVAQDDIMYIGSRRYVHSYDGTSDTFVSQDLDVGQLFDVVGFTETDQDLVIFVTNTFRTSRRGIARALFWDAARPTNAYKVVEIEDDDISAPFKYKGTIGCFTGNRANGGWTTLRLFDGRRFVPVFSYNGNKPGNRGVFVQNDMILWLAGGLVYAYGSRDNTFPKGVFQITGGSGSTDGGFLTSLITGVLYASTGTGSSGGLQKYSSSAFHNQANWQSITAAPNFPRGYKGRITEVKVTFAATCSGGRTLQFLVQPSSSAGSSETIATISTVTAATMVQRWTGLADGTDFPEFENFKITATVGDGAGSGDAPQVEKIEVFYRLVKIK